MRKQRNVMTYVACIGAITVLTVVGSLFQGDFVKTTDDNGSGYLAAQGIKSSIKSDMSNILTVMDFADEAGQKGYKIAQIPQQIFAEFNITSKGVTVARIPVPLYGSTNEGVLYLNSILPLSMPADGSDIYLWKNGNAIPISRAVAAEKEVAIQLPLDKGTNYLCFLIKSKNQWWGRSRVLKVDSPGAEEKKETPPAPVFNDYWEEAHSKGYGNMPKKDSIIGFMGFTITSHGNVITDIPAPLSGSTSEGVVDSNIVLPSTIPASNNNVYLWNNGEETLIDKNARPTERTISKVVLARGGNYICGIVKNAGKYIGRTPMVLVNSSVSSSIARFEMTWDGSGDMDLHVESLEKGWHVGFQNSNVDQQGNRANLDIDNMSGFGPENIRIFSLSGQTSVRCFVNYYSGGSTVNVTVRYFDKDNKVVKSETKNFNPGMTQGTPYFNPRSWLVGTFTITP